MAKGTSTFKTVFCSQACSFRLLVFCFQAWHAWALMNYEAVLFYKQTQTQEQGDGATPTTSGADPGVSTATHEEVVYTRVGDNDWYSLVVHIYFKSLSEIPILWPYLYLLIVQNFCVACET